MSTTRTKFPVGVMLAVLLGVVALAAVALEQTGEPTGSTGTARCRGERAEVAFAVELGRTRPVQVEYWITGLRMRENVDTNQWVAVDETVTCPGHVELTVRRRDVWGGKTSCRIEVDGRVVARDETTGQAECHAAVELVAE